MMFAGLIWIFGAVIGFSVGFAVGTSLWINEEDGEDGYGE